MADIIQFPRRTLEDRLQDLVRQFDPDTAYRYVPQDDAIDKLMRDYFRLVCQECR